MAYLISLWFLHSFRKSLIAKFVSITIMVGVAWAVWNTLEFKKDFNGGASYTYMFDRKVSKDELKKALTFRDDHYKEYAPVIAASRTVSVSRMPVEPCIRSERTT